MVRPEDVRAGDVVEKFQAMVRPAVHLIPVEVML